MLTLKYINYECDGKSRYSRLVLHRMKYQLRYISCNYQTLNISVILDI